MFKEIEMTHVFTNSWSKDITISLHNDVRDFEAITRGKLMTKQMQITLTLGINRVATLKITKLAVRNIIKMIHQGKACLLVILVLTSLAQPQIPGIVFGPLDDASNVTRNFINLLVDIDPNHKIKLGIIRVQPQSPHNATATNATTNGATTAFILVFNDNTIIQTKLNATFSGSGI